MRSKVAYSSEELAQIFAITGRAILFKAKREKWQSQPRVGRGGGNEWLVASMPEATQEVIRKAEERRAIEEETAQTALLSDALCPDTNLAALPSQTRQAILDKKRRHKALLKSDLLAQWARIVSPCLRASRLWLVM